jgi:tetratricopeptide (TPR) repeat protein
MRRHSAVRLAALAAFTLAFALAAADLADAAAKPARKGAKAPAKKVVKAAPADSVQAVAKPADSVHVLAQTEPVPVADPVVELPKRDPWREARALADRGQSDSALAVLRTALTSEPLDFGLRWLEAGILGESGKHAEAVTLFDRLAAEFPDRAGELLSDRAEARFESGDARGAADDLSAWLTLHPDDADARLRFARALVGCDELSDALAAYDAYLMRVPTDTEAGVERARTIGWTGRHGAAIAAFDSVLARDPDNTDALFGLAQNQNWNGDNRGAARRLEVLVEREPDHEEAWMTLAQARYWDEDPDGALVALAKVEALEPGHAEAKSLSARIVRERRARLEVAHERSDDSDGLAVRTPSVEMTWPLAKGTTASVAWQMDLANDDDGSSNVRQLSGGLHRRWSPMWATYVRGSLANWKEGSGAGRGGEAGVVLRPLSRVRLEVVTAREPVLTRIAMEENISMLQWVFAADWNAMPRLHLSASGRAGSYSDGNNSERTAFAASWTIRDDARWELGARLSLDQLNVHEQLDHGYYDPDFYREWGPGFEVAMRPDSHWRLSADVKTGWQTEKGSPTELHYGLEAGAEWMPDLDWTLALAGGIGDSNLKTASGYQRGWWRLGLVRAF